MGFLVKPLAIQFTSLASVFSICKIGNHKNKSFHTHGIRYHNFIANRWRNNGNSERFYFWGSKITADGDYSHEIKRHLLLGRKAMTNLNSILKSRDITFLTKVPLVKALVFPVVTYGCESWTIKKAEHQIPDAFYCGIGEDS